MKKLQTLILCTVVGLAGVVLVNAKELTSVKTNVSSDKITDAYAQLNTDDQKGITEVVENADSTCIIDLNYKPREYTEQLIDNCLLTDNRDPKVCDRNRDGDVNISDITYFIDLCVLGMSKTEDLPTYSQNSQNNKNINKKNPTSNLKEMATGYMYKTGMNSLTGIIKTGNENSVGNTNCEDYAELLINNCLLNENRDLEKCDIDGDGKPRISDVTEFIDECLMQTNTASDNNEEDYSGSFCDFNKDYEINIADVNRFNENCKITNSTNNTKCDVNYDGEFNIADINIFNYRCTNEILGNNKNYVSDSDNGSNNSGSSLPNDTDSKNVNVFDFANKYGLTTAPTFEKFNNDGTLKRGAMAKMISNYAINILGLKPDTSKKCSFSDVSNKLDSGYDYGITKACQLGLMGQKTTKFNPYNEVTEGQFSTVLSRMISGIEDGKGDKKYYEPHIEYLCKMQIIKCTENPKDLIKRGDAFLRLMEASNKIQLKK